MLENLGKSVVLTGSQVPMMEQRNDGCANLLGALIVAGHFTIPEVGVYFHDNLYRGNRTTKLHATKLDAFGSPNLPPLVKMGIDVDVDWDAVFRPANIAQFSVQQAMDPNVCVLRIFPGITPATITALCTALSSSISTVLTVLSWICAGIYMCGALPSPVCA